MPLCKFVSICACRSLGGSLKLSFLFLGLNTLNARARPFQHTDHRTKKIRRTYPSMVSTWDPTKIKISKHSFARLGPT
ncbi:hypothetical protein V1506DRAFT_527675 [Lipomyces tetrasporus]